MTLNEIKDFLKKNNLHPLKSFGQNFLISFASIKSIIEEVKKHPSPYVEIGPGPGSLTRHFEKQEILLIEKDKKLARIWKEKGFQVLCLDALKMDFESLPSSFTLFSNLPYEIAGRLILQMCQKNQVPVMILTMQKEVAKRVMSKKGSKDYSLLSVLSQTFFDVRKIRTLGKGEFYPIPKVDGQVLEFKRKKTKLPPLDFLQFVKSCFENKRKMLFKKLPLPKEEAYEALESLGFKKTSRAEDLSVPDFIKLFQSLKKL